MPLSLPNFFHMPESRLIRGLAPTSLIGGLVGGVIGLSFVGLPVLPLSSVMPGPELLPERFRSDPLLVVPPLVVAAVVEKFAAAGAEVVGESLTLNRALFIAVANCDGADIRLTAEGGE